MHTPTTRDVRLNICCDDRARQLLDKAAAYARTSVSDFVLTHALASAEEVVQAHESITLASGGFQTFLAVLDGPGEPNAPLVRAFDRHRDQVWQ